MNYWAFAEHLGEALELMKIAAGENELSNPVWRSADYWGSAQLPEGVDQAENKIVFYYPMRYCFNSDSKPALLLPYGVIGSDTKGRHDYRDIHEGYLISKKGDLQLIEATISDTRLLQDYEDVVSVFDCLEVFWCRIHDHWYDRGEEFYVNRDLRTVEDVHKFILANSESTIRNGYVSLTSYFTEGKTNVTITDHKRLFVSSRSDDCIKRALTVLNDLGYSRKRKLISIDGNMHHWHFRDPKGLDRDDLAKKLKMDGFEFWKPDHGSP